MAITFIKEVTTGMRFIYTKDSNPAVNIIISRINTYSKSTKKTDILLNLLGSDITIRLSNETDRDTAMDVIDDEF